jgi:hypothetical protein
MALIPPEYLGATTDLPEADQWCKVVLAGGSARLLVLGPIWSGKTHTAFALLQRLLDAGLSEGDIQVVDAGTLRLGGRYDPTTFEAGPRVTFFDDLTGPVDNRVGRTVPYEADEPEIQAVMAVGRGAVSDAVERLVARSGGSWIACASGRSQLEESLGEDTAGTLVAGAHWVVELPPRPLPAWD